jgi:glutathione S-transferase
MPRSDPYLVHGLTCSYFTRKMTGYLDHLGVPWRLEPSVGLNPPARELGWNGGIPVVSLPDGEMIWDSTAMIEHLDTKFPDRGVLPDDPDLRFLAYLLDDFSDEWFYRHAVGTRWLYEENRTTGVWDITREASIELGLPAEPVRARVMEAMTGSVVRLGATPENIGAWVDESLVPWLRVFGPHVHRHGFLLGSRPSLADFAFFGGSIAHFVNDRWCRRLLDEAAPEVVAHTHGMTRPGPEQLGTWFDVDELPDTLDAVVAEAGRHYLPWVAEATVRGEATVQLGDATATIATTNFLNEARGIMLARYVQARSARLDAILERAGILGYYADHVDQATAVPDPTTPPRPLDNRPYPAEPPDQPA